MKIIWSWLQALTILLEKSKRPCFVFILIILPIFCLEARQQFQFQFGDKVHVLSDKGYRRTRDNVFEAVGNVVITHKSKALYGEKATMAMNTGDTTIVGNVRYVGPHMTLYGSQIDYNFLSGQVSVKNARIISDNYVVLGKELSRVSEDVFVGNEAEYTTCRDCPESWSIFGKKVHITLGQYIRISHAFLKVRGVVVMYIPYIIFPIKKTRETGLLFPSFGFNLNQGIRFQQPWFWAIDDHRDMTLMPSVWGRRGPGGELQYRHILGHRKWFEVNSLHVYDRIYREFKADNELSGDHIYRHFYEYEHQFSFGNNINHHLHLNDANDLDIIRDFEQFIGYKIEGTTLGASTFLDKRFTQVDVSVDAHFRKNQLVNSAKKFDHSFVQVLPGVSLEIEPQTVFSSDATGFKNLSVGLNGDYAFFKQNHYQELTFIRNAHRFNTKPYFSWNLGHLGPIEASSKVIYDYQYYNFPFESTQKWFSKSGMIYENEISLELEKYFGVSYREKVPAEKVDLKDIPKKKKKKVSESNFIGALPTYQEGTSKDNFEIIKNSYRHNQILKLKHYYIANQKTNGSAKFRSQLTNLDGSPNSNGLFDPVDTIRGRENELNYLESRTNLPISNTLELQWNNFLVRKAPKEFNIFQDEQYIRNNFSYSTVAYFKLSQGVDFNSIGDRFSDRLTRLAVQTGLSFNQTTFSASEYYYHRNSDHITTINLTQSFDLGKIGASLTYDSFTEPVNKFATFNFTIQPMDIFSLGTGYDYDIDQKQTSRSIYTVNYLPTNNCWMLELAYETTQIQKRFSFNFLINFNDNSFQSLSGAQQ